MTSNGNPKIEIGIYVAGTLMIVFGIAEVATGFRHRFFGLTTAQNTLATWLGVSLGGFYFFSGVLTLFRRKWSAIIAIILLCGDVVGRILMVVTSLYPVNTVFQTVGIVIGTGIAAFFTVYLMLKLKSMA
jgi:hypothetical protein